MRKQLAALLLALAGCRSRPLVIPQTGRLVLAAGVIEVHSPLILPEGAHDLEISGSGTTLHAAADFHGKAIFMAKSAVRIRFRDFTMDGNRDALEQRVGLPGYDTPFQAFTANNGILVEGGGPITISEVSFRQVAGFSVLVSGAKQVRIERVNVSDSGSRDAAGKNNTTGGILIEEGTAGFQVVDCKFESVRGNGVWTHSLYTSPRSQDGLIARNSFREIARDAIQVGHAARVRVERNTGSQIGFPEALVDAIPVAIDTAGNVDRSVYTENRFSDINGKCIDLDGFHDGEVSKNVCLSQSNFGIVMNNTNRDMRPEQVTISDNLIDGGRYGGIFVIGGPNRILRNRLQNLNQSHSTDALLGSGIYLGSGAERPAPARGNIVEDNEITGFAMKTHCVVADPKVELAANTVARNRCAER